MRWKACELPKKSLMADDTKLVALDIDGTLLAPGVPHDALPENDIVEAVDVQHGLGDRFEHQMVVDLLK